MKVLVVNNQKGGVGKSTIAVHLAWYFAELGQRVLFVDLEGLSNLFEGLDDVAGAVAATGAPLEIALDAIEEDPNQPRTRFSRHELDELAASIVERGVRHPPALGGCMNRSAPTRTGSVP